MKRKVKIILLILASGIALFLLYSNYRVQGTWMRVHQYRNDGQSIAIHLPSVLSFSTLTIKNYDLTGDETVKVEPYEIIGKKIFVDPNSFHPLGMSIKTITNDSIVFTDNYASYVFQKIPDSLQTRDSILISDRAFRLVTKYRIDTVYFDQQHMYYKNETKKGPSWRKFRYKLVYIDDFQFLAGNFGNILPIKSEKEKLRIYSLGRDSIKVISANEVILDSIHMKELKEIY